MSEAEYEQLATDRILSQHIFASQSNWLAHFRRIHSQPGPRADDNLIIAAEPAALVSDLFVGADFELYPRTAQQFDFDPTTSF